MLSMNHLQKENLNSHIDIKKVNINPRESFSSSSGYYKCPTCFYKTSSYTFLMVHFRSVHRDEKTPFVCHHEGCGFVTITSGLLAVHMRKHVSIPTTNTNTNTNDSDKDKSCHTRDVLQGEGEKELEKGDSNGDNNNNDVRPYRCGLCPFTCIDSKTISFHRTYSHSDQLKCPYCKYSTNKSDNLERHVKLHETMVGKPQWKLETIWFCSEENCTFQTWDNKVVAIHLRRFHNLPKIYIASDSFEVLSLESGL